jgi:hypothetical protein
MVAGYRVGGLSSATATPLITTAMDSKAICFATSLPGRG